MNKIIDTLEELLEEIGAEDIEDAKKVIYDKTECGAWIDLDDEERVVIGSIVEGSDSEVGPFELTFPFLIGTFWEQVEEINDEACAIFDMENSEDWEAEDPLEDIELFF